ncbi:enoyl-CoA hydratase-related protein [Umboniibacter marinipuniceus]|uniref:Methylglutaconyl-CoA hydratase n=1 Tax=Umboniibacter marinipuniceus TaxID=569599 RepID=A0A3M0A295_9GAMM|nr:enoyl-CoA hydratase-related protein [Umboniibacter marinipuniceus]RMA79311.1 methylglutaconyl-CoA hydratase [Umboniibacter marinipuniceus]
MESLIKVKFDGAVARITLDNPERHNAFNASVIAELRQSISELAQNSAVRLLVLNATGTSFCAGADLAWMKEMAQFSQSENLDDARQLAALFQQLAEFPAPTLCVVQGAAFGGAIGLIACCDLVLASNRAEFCLSEVKLGLSPATISPYVMRAMGYRNTMRFALTAERFNADEALAADLIHWIAKLDDLAERQTQLEKQLLGNGPEAMRATKALLQQVNESSMNEMIEPSCELIAALRVSTEGQEGLNAFFERRAPSWRTK